MKQITEDYCSYEIAKLLKEKGFDEPCIGFYNPIDGCFFEASIRKSWDYNRHGSINAPTHQMALKWLREVHNIDIIAPPQFDNAKWTYSAIIFKLSIPCTEIRLNDNKDKKEEAYEVAIKYTLENLI